MNTSIKGRRGERIVQALLPSSELVNEDKELQQPYDILWDGIQIDVKTRYAPSDSNPNAYSFNARENKRHNGTVIVCVGIRGDKPYLWVSKYQPNMSLYFFVADAILPADLPTAILAIHALPTPLIEVDRSHRAISVTDADYIFFEEFAEKVSAGFGVKLKIVQALKMAVTQYEVKKGLAK